MLLTWVELVHFSHTQYQLNPLCFSDLVADTGIVIAQNPYELDQRDFDAAKGTLGRYFLRHRIGGIGLQARSELTKLS